jgi:hypothetical protein
MPKPKPIMLIKKSLRFIPIKKNNIVTIVLIMLAINRAKVSLDNKIEYVR